MRPQQEPDLQKASNPKIGSQPPGRFPLIYHFLEIRVQATKTNYEFPLLFFFHFL